jgi:hypothetical protein
MEVVRKLECTLRLGILGGVVLVLIAATLLQPAIPQPTNYHRFADHRAFLGIANFLDVFSNLGFLIIGAWGLWILLRSPAEGAFLDESERWPWVVTFLGLVLTCAGSMYYHLSPTNQRLVWDRLPLTLIFTSVLSATIAERINVRAGLASLPPLVALGLWSVVVWRLSEVHGAEDLRLYLFVQFLPAAVIPVIMLLFPPRYTHGLGLLPVLGLYIVAKVFELFDRQVYHARHLVSGHTLKHLLAALAMYFIVRMLKKRQPIAQPAQAMAAAQD